MDDKSYIGEVGFTVELIDLVITWITSRVSEGEHTQRLSSKDDGRISIYLSLSLCLNPGTRYQNTGY